MKITLPGLDDGAVASSEAGRQYRVRNHIAHIRPEDFGGLGLNEYSHTRFDAHPFDPMRTIRREFAPTILMQESAPVYDDAPQDEGDFSHPDDAVSHNELAAQVRGIADRPMYAAPVVTAADIIAALGGMSAEERGLLAAALGAGDTGAEDSGGEESGETQLDSQGGVEEPAAARPAAPKRRR